MSKRSLKAVGVEKILKIMYSSYRNYHKIYLKKLKTKDETYTLPKKFQTKYPYTLEKDMNLNYLKLDSKSKKVIIYLHGGAFVTTPCSFHLKFIFKIHKHFNYLTYVPLYPLAPFHTYKEALEALKVFYLEVLKTYDAKDIILLGDSSGGGLLVNLLNYLESANIETPKVKISFSPWLDLTLSNPLVPLKEKVDPMLKKASIEEIASCYKGELDFKDPLIYPLEYQSRALNDLIIYAGEKDILYPDIELFHAKAIKNNLKVILKHQEKMVHDYVLLPINEASEALKEIIQDIENS